MLLNVFMVTDACQVLEIYVLCIIENKVRLLTPKDKTIWFWILIPLDLDIFRVNFKGEFF